MAFNTTDLHRVLTEAFNSTEQRTLCLDLGLNYDSLDGRGTASKAHDILATMTRHGRLQELADYVHQKRPSWHFKLSAFDDPISPSAFHQTPKHNILHGRNRHFSGREEWLTRLHQALKNGQTAVVTQAIAGLGGVGKTQLALEYCHRHLDAYSLIWWLVAENEVTLAESVSELGQALGLPISQLPDPQARVAAVKHTLAEKPEPWLLVIDNADTISPDAVVAVLPSTGHGYVLITSRSPNWDALAQVMRLDVFEPTEAIRFLLERSGQASSTEAAALAETLGYFPLALEHAAAYVRQTDCTLGEYERLFKTQRQAILAEAERPIAYHNTITTTWQLAFQKVKTIPGALDLLNLCSFLAPEEIPLSLIRGMKEETSDYLKKLGVLLPDLVADPLALNKAIAALRRYSLMQRTGDELTMHRLVQMVARDLMRAEKQQIWGSIAVEFVTTFFPNIPNMLHTWSEGAVLLPHITTVADLTREHQIESQAVAALCNRLGYFLNFRGDYQLAKPYYERALAIREKVLDPDHPDTAISLNNLGRLLREMGNLTEARPFYERALAIFEKVFGPDHSYTAASLNDIGLLLQANGDLVEARPYYERALGINQKALGPDHPYTARCLTNLGHLLQAMGNLTAAHPYYERAFAINEKALGPDHPATATSLNSLGFLLYTVGDMVAARPYYERALAIREKVLGSDHPDTAQSLNNLALLLYYYEDYQESARLMQQAIVIREKRLGSKHSDTIESRNSLATIEAKLS